MLTPQTVEYLKYLQKKKLFISPITFSLLTLNKNMKCKTLLPAACHQTCIMMHAVPQIREMSRDLLVISFVIHSSLENWN